MDFAACPLQVLLLFHLQHSPVMGVLILEEFFAPSWQSFLGWAAGLVVSSFLASSHAKNCRLSYVSASTVISFLSSCELFHWVALVYLWIQEAWDHAWASWGWWVNADHCMQSMPRQYLRETCLALGYTSPNQSMACPSLEGSFCTLWWKVVWRHVIQLFQHANVF